MPAEQNDGNIFLDWFEGRSAHSGSRALVIWGFQFSGFGLQGSRRSPSQSLRRHRHGRGAAHGQTRIPLQGRDGALPGGSDCSMKHLCIDLRDIFRDSNLSSIETGDRRRVHEGVGSSQLGRVGGNFAPYPQRARTRARAPFPAGRGGKRAPTDNQGRVACGGQEPRIVGALFRQTHWRWSGTKLGLRFAHHAEYCHVS